MQGAEKDYILVLPTWRQTLLEPISGVSNFRRLIDGFEDSEYFRSWMGFLSDPGLRRAADAAGLAIAFAPHPNLQPHLDQFAVPEWIDLLDYANGDVKDWIARARLVVTDYSSLAFDAAFANVPVVYYQFDRETFFSGGHAYRRGEFDHGHDGFGPVCFDQASAVQETVALALEPEASTQYRSRIRGAFAHRDGKNSERVVASIEELTRPHPAAK
jgi:CDP-glycerol glycerophosphotransferase (TagB/SpsB family)